MILNRHHIGELINRQGKMLTEMSQLSSLSLSENKHSETRKVKAQQNLEDSVCFSKVEMPDHVLNDSVIFSSRSKIKNTDCYQLCPMEDMKSIEQSGRAFRYAARE